MEQDFLTPLIISPYRPFPNRAHDAWDYSVLGCCCVTGTFSVLSRANRSASIIYRRLVRLGRRLRVPARPTQRLAGPQRKFRQLVNGCRAAWTDRPLQY